MFCDKEERLLYVLTEILRKLFQNKTNKFLANIIKTSDHDNNVLLFKLKYLKT